MTIGRVKYYDDERIEQMADQLLEWAKLPDSWNLNGFCCSREKPIPAKYVSEWAKKNTWFKEAYDIARATLAERREKTLSKGDLHVKAYDLNVSVYDEFQKQDKRAQGEFDMKLKRDAALDIGKSLSDKEWKQEAKKIIED